MKERRNLPRKYLIIYSRVFDQGLGKLLGYLSDLSEQGAMIIAEESLEVNAILPLRFDLPDPKFFHAHNLNITARVAHCDIDISPAFYDIGLEFLEVTPEQKIVIQTMMDVYEFRHANQSTSAG
ncbi:MAG: PilZ domain-containing protein [Anaerolineaceae bacterium]|nr:MAG: PilZ domain-containing protein [Anaerolineaceae bacterium]